MGSNMTFGVGSFHFAWQPAVGIDPTPEVYMSALKEALNSVQTINNVTINHAEHDTKYDSPNEIPDWGSGEGYFPPLSFTTLKFELYIPERVQRELLADLPGIDVGIERFQVHHTYGYDAPVTFIVPVDSPSETDPSNSVVVVRKYLETQFATPRSGISFQSLGPSPLHADFYVEPCPTVASTDPPFQVTVAESSAYDRVTCCYNGSEYESVEDAVDDLFYELVEELALSYAITAADARAIERWGFLQEAVSRLTTQDVNAGRLKRAWRAFGRGREIGKLLESLANFEAGGLIDAHLLEQSYRGTYRGLRTTSLRSIVDDTRAGRWNFPVAQVEKIARNLESQHSRATEMIIVLFSAVLGGAIGALLTNLAN